MEFVSLFLETMNLVYKFSIQIAHGLHFGSMKFYTKLKIKKILQEMFKCLGSTTNFFTREKNSLISI